MVQDWTGSEPPEPFRPCQIAGSWRKPWLGATFWRKTTMVSAHYKAPRTTLGWGGIFSVLFSMMILVSSMNPNSTGSHAPGGNPSVGGSVTGFGFRSLLSEIVGTKAPDASFGVSYIVLIDAGSSGSRVHVFSLSGGEGPLPDLHLPSKKLKVPAQELAGSLAHLSRNHL